MEQKSDQWGRQYRIIIALCTAYYSFTQAGHWAQRHSLCQLYIPALLCFVNTHYIAANMDHTRDQQHFTISEVAAANGAAAHMPPS